MTKSFFTKLRLDYKKITNFLEINIDEIAADSKLGTESELVTLALQKRPDLKSLQNLKNRFLMISRQRNQHNIPKLILL